MLVVDNHSKHMDALLQELGDYTLIDFEHVEDIECNSYDAVILSGGSTSIVGNEHRYRDELDLIKKCNVPMLGICLGFELIAYAFGERLIALEKKVNEVVVVHRLSQDDLLDSVPESFKVKEAHRWAVSKTAFLMPLARSKDGIEIFRHPKKRVYGVQFHPECMAEGYGMKILKNFLGLVVQRSSVVSDFASAKAYLESLIPKEKVNYEILGLARMRALLKEMGDPQDTYPTVHVTGTAGKGSVATMIAKITEETGYKTGLHVSPHLTDIRERMQVNGRFPNEDEFVDLIRRIKVCVERVEKRTKHGKPSYFEAMLAASFENFKRQKIDIAVIEVGMGGRLDGTNVITPKVVVLTNVGLDHMAYLGDTVEKIAYEKVGIFKKGVPVESGVTQPSIIKIAKKRADELECRLDFLGGEIGYSRVRQSKTGSRFDLVIHGKRYADVELSMFGEHQVSNATLAVAAAMTLNSSGFRIGEKDFRKALSSISVPGRFELVSRSPTVIMDGAHNPMKVGSLVKTMNGCYPKRKIYFVFGVMHTKNVRAMLGLLSPIAAKFYFTSFQSTTDFGKSMSYDPKKMERFTNVESEVIVDSVEAYRKAIADAGAREIICVTGSFYLVGELRKAALG